MSENGHSLEISTTWGTLAVQMVDDHVVGCTLPRLDETPTPPFAMIRPDVNPVSNFMAAVFGGRKVTVPAIGSLAGSDFQKDVWKAISAISTGETKSYGQVARSIGKPTAFRAVANACGANPVPLFIPCHRVIGANNTMGGFSAGIAWKYFLLSVEH